MNDKILQLLGIDINQVAAIRNANEEDGVELAGKMIIQFKEDAGILENANIKKVMSLDDFAGVISKKAILTLIEKQKPKNMDKLNELRNKMDAFRQKNSELKEIHEKLKKEYDDLMQLYTKVKHENKEEEADKIFEKSEIVRQEKDKIFGEMQSINQEVRKHQEEFNDQISFAIQEAHQQLVANLPQERLDKLRTMIEAHNNEFIKGSFGKAQEFEIKINEEIEKIKMENLSQIIFAGAVRDIFQMEILIYYSLTYSSQGIPDEPLFLQKPQSIHPILDAPLEGVYSKLSVKSEKSSRKFHNIMLLKGWLNTQNNEKALEILKKLVIDKEDAKTRGENKTFDEITHLQKMFVKHLDHAVQQIEEATSHANNAIKKFKSIIFDPKASKEKIKLAMEGLKKEYKKIKDHKVEMNRVLKMISAIDNTPNLKNDPVFSQILTKHSQKKRKDELSNVDKIRKKLDDVAKNMFYQINRFELSSAPGANEMLQLLGIDLNQVEGVRLGDRDDGGLAGKYILIFKEEIQSKKKVKKEIELANFSNEASKSSVLKRIIEKQNLKNKSQLINLLNQLIEIENRGGEPKEKDKIQEKFDEELQKAINEVKSQLKNNISEDQLNRIKALMDEYNKNVAAGFFLQAQQIKAKINDEMNYLKRENFAQLAFLGIMQGDNRYRMIAIPQLAQYCLIKTYDSLENDLFKKDKVVISEVDRVLENPLNSLFSEILGRPEFYENFELEGLVNKQPKEVADKLMSLLQDENNARDDNNILKMVRTKKNRVVSYFSFAIEQIKKRIDIETSKSPIRRTLEEVISDPNTSDENKKSAIRKLLIEYRSLINVKYELRRMNILMQALAKNPSFKEDPIYKQIVDNLPKLAELGNALDKVEKDLVEIGNVEDRVKALNQALHEEPTTLPRELQTANVTQAHAQPPKIARLSDADRKRLIEVAWAPQMTQPQTTQKGTDLKNEVKAQEDVKQIAEADNVSSAASKLQRKARARLLKQLSTEKTEPPLEPTPQPTTVPSSQETPSRKGVFKQFEGYEKKANTQFNRVKAYKEQKKDPRMSEDSPPTPDSKKPPRAKS